MSTLSTQGMETLPAARTVEPFGKINLWRHADGSVTVRGYILQERIIEGARTGIAIDGSASMRPAFGMTGFTGWLLSKRNSTNLVSESAQDMCAYLASKLDAGGTTRAIYWACGDGSKIEEIGDLSAEEAKSYDFQAPKDFGTRTKLLPALKYFVESFEDAKWGMYIFITDGALQDLEQVQDYCIQLASNIASGRRNDLKLVMIGVGKSIKKKQMLALDDLETGTDLDLWDHKIATEMSELAEIFAEVVDENTVVAPSGMIRDPAGEVVVDYRDKGVPELLHFDLPPNSTYFTLEIAGQSVRQDIA